MTGSAGEQGNGMTSAAWMFSTAQSPKPAIQTFRRSRGIGGTGARCGSGNHP
jgi:hypothetical protein